MQIDAVKPGPVSQPQAGPKAAPADKEGAQKPAPADTPMINMGPKTDEFKPSSKKE